MNETQEMRRLFAVATEDMPIPGGKRWLRVPGPDTRAGVPALEVTQVGGTTTGLGQLNPQDLLALLQRSSQVSAQGRRPGRAGPGWTGTGTGTAYTFTASLTTRGPSRLRLSSTGTVDVDRQGRVRQLDATETTGRTVHRPG